MRPAKFFFALIFGAVFLITLLKVLFFGLMAALVVSGIFLAGRAFRRFGPGSGYDRYRYFQEQNEAWQAPFLSPEQAPFAQPLDPNWQKKSRPTPLGRRIEVL